MSVVKQYRCDLSGEFIDKEDVMIVRVGTLDDRPEDCERLDVGPCCKEKPVQDILVKFAELRSAAG